MGKRLTKEEKEMAERFALASKMLDQCEWYTATRDMFRRIRAHKEMVMAMAEERKIELPSWEES